MAYPKLKKGVIINFDKDGKLIPENKVNKESPLPVENLEKNNIKMGENIKVIEKSK